MQLRLLAFAFGAVLVAGRIVAAKAEPTPVRSGPTPHADVVAAGPVFAVAASLAGVVASIPDGIVWVGADGRVVRKQIAGPTSGSSVTTTADAAAERREQTAADHDLFDRHGFDHDLREEVEGEDWLDDMRPRAARRLRAGAFASASGSVPPLVAAAGGLAYAFARGRLYRVVGGSLSPAANDSGTHQGIAVSQAGAVALWSQSRVTMTLVSPSAQCRFAPLTAIDDLVLLATPAPVGQPCSGNSVLWRHGGQVGFAAAGEDATSLPWRARSLAPCGAGAILNADEGLLTASGSGGNFTRIADAAPYPVVRCLPEGDDAMLSFSIEGQGAAVSLDRGRTWQTLAAATGVAIADAAITTQGAWLATPSGLWHVTAASQAAPVRAEPPAGTAARLPSWQSWLPHVDVVAAVATRSAGPRDAADGRAASEVWLAADFPLAPKPASGAPSAARLPPATLPPQPHAAPACLDDLRRAAIDLALADPARVRSLIFRARHAGWLPELRLRAEKRLGRNQAADFEADAAFTPLAVRTIDDMRLEVRATWDLSRIVYSPDELAATVQAARLADVRREVATLVNRLFFERRRRDEFARHEQAIEHVPGVDRTADTAGSIDDRDVDADVEDATDDTRAPRIRPLRSTSNLQALRTAELSADLDALTGGLAGTCR